MNKYKVTGREADKETLIIEELKHPDDHKYPNIREIIGNRQKPKGGQNSVNQHRKFFLEATRGDKQGCRYCEAGYVMYYPTKKAAKRARNVLNHKFGASFYKIVRWDITPKELEKDLDELNQMKMAFGFIPLGSFAHLPPYDGD